MTGDPTFVSAAEFSGTERATSFATGASFTSVSLIVTGMSVVRVPSLALTVTL